MDSVVHIDVVIVVPTATVPMVCVKLSDYRECLLTYSDLTEVSINDHEPEVTNKQSKTKHIGYPVSVT